MKKLIIAILALMPVLVNVYSASAQTPAVITSDKAGWHKIGDRTADFKAEKDEIVVLGADNFKALKIKATDAPIHIVDLEVYFEGGEKQVVNLDKDYNTGEESTVIDLKGNGKDISKVVFVYHTVPNSKNEKAEIELYGMK